MCGGGLQPTAWSNASSEENPNTVAKLCPTLEQRALVRAAFARGDFPPGFVFSGGVEEDLDALEDFQVGVGKDVLRCWEL
jgi:hypothetical protein